jgi:hypothetical protein
MRETLLSLAVVTMAAVSPAQGQCKQESFGATGSDHAKEGIARVELAIQESRITSRIPDLECVCYMQGAGQGYGGPGIPGSRSIRGEKVQIVLRHRGEMAPLAEASWSTKFPSEVRGGLAYTVGSNAEYFLPAEVSAEDILIKLLHLNVFTPEDLSQLTSSGIPEVRVGAASNLADRSANQIGDYGSGFRGP